jgi:hypothetical protein
VTDATPHTEAALRQAVSGALPVDGLDGSCHGGATR